MNKAFIRAAAERAVKTFAQTLVAVLGIGLTDVLAVDWKAALSAAGAATLLSILTSLGSDWATGSGPSLTNAEVIEPELDEWDHLDNEEQ
jgi:hypothetical protein